MDIWENEQYKEIWVYLEETAMMALINGNYGWLMYINEEGDSGLSSRNPFCYDNKQSFFCGKSNLYY